MNNPATEAILRDGIRYGLGIAVATIEAVVRAEGDETGTLTRIASGIRDASAEMKPDPTTESPANP